MSAYGSSPAKRQRRTRNELDAIDGAIIEAVAADSPVTLRGVFYRVVSAGAVDKTELGYRLVGRQLLKLRRSGPVSYASITDGTRWITRPRTWGNLDQMLEDASSSYRRALWHDQPAEVHVYTEKDAISGVILPVTEQYDVPLGVLRGYASESFAWSVAPIASAPFRTRIGHSRRVDVLLITAQCATFRTRSVKGGITDMTGCTRTTEAADPSVPALIPEAVRWTAGLESRAARRGLAPEPGSFITGLAAELASYGYTGTDAPDLARYFGFTEENGLGNLGRQLTAAMGEATAPAKAYAVPRTRSRYSRTDSDMAPSIRRPASPRVTHRSSTSSRPGSSDSRTVAGTAAT